MKITGDEEEIDGCESIIESVKVHNTTTRQCLDVCKITGTIVHAYIRPLADENWKTMGATDDGAMGIQDTCPIHQERTDVLIG